ncbi:MAG: DUF362 domain-containing protein [Marinilabiliaceae bacterium]|nr:DUF362 domain-containing protein [Marinilabiliaceae bacterium]
MKRRDFILKSVGLGIVSGLAPFFGGLESVYGSNFSSAGTPLAAVRGGEPEVMFDKAIEALGGLSKFIKAGQSVLVKPNIGWDAPPERAANTNPQLVGHIVKRCYEAGAKEVRVFDRTCNQWDRCYKNSQIEKFVTDAGGKMIPGNVESYYQEVHIPNGKRLKKTKVHRLILESDVFINVPILKHHSSTYLSLGMKNLMGVVWDRGYYHSNDLNQCIADFVSYRKPDLTIIDGYNMLTKNGPRGVSTADVVNLKALIASSDIVAADAAAAKLFGSEPAEIEHIKIANDMGLGTMDLTSLAISRIKV